MKELEVTIRVRNNRLKQRRDELGWTQARMACAVGCTRQAYGRLECMRVKPRAESGGWLPTSLKLAMFHCVPIEELFPESVEAIDEPVAVRLVDGDEMALLSESSCRAALPPDVEYARKEWALAVHSALETLIPQHQRIVKMRVGIDTDEHTYREIGEALGVCHETASAQMGLAIRELRAAVCARPAGSHER